MIFLFTSIVAFILGFLCNVWASHLTQRIAIIGEFAGLQLVHNPGIAYGIRISSPWQELVIVAALGLVIYSAWHERKSRLLSVAFGLIVGGALGNMVDRLLNGFVTDYFQVGTFYIFNVPDSLITIGAGLLLLQGFLDWRRKRAAR
ncbi:MAG: signal peptidase II [Candidatus Peribacteraceae bacterium]|nr:signal peptidase II [Candidatus Peribacteraceae bacterium]